MDKNKILNQIQARLKSLEAEYKALSEAKILLTQNKTSDKALNTKSLVKLAEQSAKAKLTGKGTAGIKAIGTSNRRKRSSNGFSKKVVQFFQSSGKFLPTSVIAAKFKSSYPEKNEVELSKYLAVVLSQQKAKGNLTSYSPEDKGQTGRLLMWGLPEWMDGKKPKPAFVKK